MDIYSGKNPVRPTVEPIETNDGLTKFDQLVNDARIARVWGRLQQERPFPETIQFATYVQPPAEGQAPNGIWVRQGELAVFNVVSPNPHPRHQGAGQKIKTFAHTPLADFREAEDDYWRFNGADDPVYAIFRRMLPEHLAIRRNWEELA